MPIRALAQFANDNWVVVTTAGNDADGDEAIQVFDPLAELPEPLVISKAAFRAKLAG
jgi:hypothetical protein